MTPHTSVPVCIYAGLVKHTCLTPPVAPNTTADGPTMVTVNETDSVNISCTSTGLPTPGIQWTVGGVAARFEQVDTAVEAVGSTPGSVTSVLQIVSSVPSDIGTYTCTGSSSVDDVRVGNSSDSIAVLVNVANPSKYIQYIVIAVIYMCVHRGVGAGGAGGAVAPSLFKLGGQSPPTFEDQ